MNEFEFKSKFESEKIIFLSWGEYFRDLIYSKLRKQGYEPARLLKLYPVEPRVKDINSILDKAYHRGKPYTDPYNEITDKVGIRFVVLIEEEINIFINIIENCSEISCSFDRNPIELIKQRPEFFAYKSYHYIVRNKNEIEHNGITIPINTPCEVQIRTLLQHAYAEMSHSQMYKNEDKIDHTVKRNMALSMALIEATDRLFQESQNLLRKEEKEFYKFIDPLSDYLKLDTEFFLKIMNFMVYFSYLDIIHEKKITSDVLIEFIKKNEYLIEKIKKGKAKSLLYQQPIICLIYYLIHNEKELTRELWPLTPDELAPLYADIGKSFGF